MLILAGLGHNTEEIPIGVLKYLKEVDLVFLEGYTNLIEEDMLKYLKSIREDIRVVDRRFVEEELEKIIIKNKDKKIMLLVSGSPLFATTHSYFLKFCKENGIDFKVILAPSVFDEVGKTGLSLYKFGRIVSIPFHEAESFFDDILTNYKNNMHTLVLLDLDPISNKYLSVKEALRRILELDKKRRINIFNEDKKIIICSNLGRKNEKILYITIKEALNLDIDLPACIIIPGRLNEIEEEILRCMTNC